MPFPIAKVSPLLQLRTDMRAAIARASEGRTVVSAACAAAANDWGPGPTVRQVCEADRQAAHAEDKWREIDAYLGELEDDLAALERGAAAFLCEMDKSMALGLAPESLAKALEVLRARAGALRRRRVVPVRGVSASAEVVD